MVREGGLEKGIRKTVDVGLTRVAYYRQQPLFGGAGGVLQSDGDITGSSLAASSLDDTTRYENSFLSSLLRCTQTVCTSTAQVRYILSSKKIKLVLSSLVLFNVFKTELYNVIFHHHHHYHHHHISFMKLGHFLNRSGLTYPGVSSKVFHDSFCQLGSSISLRIRGSDE